MTSAPVAGSASSTVHPLIAQLFARHGCTDVSAANIDAFVERPGHAMLVFTDDPQRVRETFDVAVIVPELVRAFPGRSTSSTSSW